MAAVTPRRARLGARLRALREERFTSGLQFARAVGWPQSRVSKLERGAQLPTRDDLERWLRATEQPLALLDELLDQVSAARVDYTTDRDVVDGSGFVDRQYARRDREAITASIVEYQPSLIPGLAQTAAYAREILAGAIGGLVGIEDGRTQVEALVAARARRQEILYDPERHVEILLGEAALLARPGAATTMRGQLDRLLVLADLPAVDIRILPFTTPMSVLPLTNFAIHDSRAVIIETLTGEQEHTDDDEVAAYLDAAQRLRTDALPADELPRRVRRALATLSGDGPE